MEQNTPKFRLRLNLFDGIVLAAALIAAAVLGWMILNPTPTQEDNVTKGSVQYTVRLSCVPEGFNLFVQVGDKVTDNIKNRPMGEIISMEVEPGHVSVNNMEARRQVLAEAEGYEDVLITIQASCGINPYGVTVEEEDYPIRVGEMAYLRGDGYMGSGMVEAIEIIETFEEESK